jgi:sulfur-oxidizing protein SoxZ
LKIETSAQAGIITVRLFLEHVMAADALCGGTDTIAFVQQLSVRYQGEKVFDADFSPALSADPFLRFRFKGETGGTLVINWSDNLWSTGAERHDVT